ncbi:TraR/DksA family transcriptional regulator [Abyssibacter profundi]|uniref:Zinc finger DksA/TraR C4-type domain-containing protein n=1 Tax=Abyssibacter profundi TaxID=2182787 RepID=A0A363UM79_9GAMM|nr:TraR/DksA C4-type zinc finger protein [Abyssibacter profundi]PWN56510.1 hypothetical protein DEH80_06675 [Abyssibacter profundi]
MTPDERERLRARLGERLTELDAELRAAKASARTVELDQSRQGRLSRMDALQAQAMNQAALQRLLNQQTAIRRALARIDQADFGRCVDCDQAIAAARLLAQPGATHCINCAE